MSAWKCWLPLKIALVVLFAVSLVIGGLSAVGIMFGYEFGIYTGETNSYFETDNCYWKLNTMAWQDVMYPYQEEWMDLEELEAQLADNSSASYRLVRIENNKAEEIFDTISPNETYSVQETFQHTWENGEVYQVTVALKKPLSTGNSLYFSNRLYDMIAGMQKTLPVLAGISALFACLCVVFLCTMVGHRKGMEAIVLNHLDRIPLDLYAVVVGGGTWLAVFGTVDSLMYPADLFANVLGVCIILVCCLLLLALLLSFATRLKVGQWWKNTIIYRLLRLLGRWGIRAVRLIVRAFRAIPMVWRTLVVTAVLLLVLLFLGSQVEFNGVALMFYFLLGLLILAAVCFGVLQMRRLQTAGQRLAAGDLETKVDTAHMYWDFRRHGENLNAIGDGMTAAVDQKMKSERLKTELITNVSHDIKTPLTSILNYVDLLQHAATEEERQEYLEVLQRQATRLKKLTEDLVEASKASTGNIQAVLVPTNVVEAIQQALGEYAERLENGSLTAVSSYPETPVTIRADGRLLWRILDNLLGNVCKYTLAGTRVYVTVTGDEKFVRIAIKNISREPLNISAEELMERFVRGDAARTTEGSGLGLNIVKSLAELQHGTLTLTVDGDLFKAELTFPRA